MLPPVKIMLQNRKFKHANQYSIDMFDGLKPYCPRVCKNTFRRGLGEDEDGKN